MAIQSYYFSACCDASVTKTFDIETTNFTVGDVVVYNNECYSNTGNPSMDSPDDTFNTPDYSGATPCSDCLLVYPCIYTFSACCVTSGLTFSIPNSEIPQSLSVGQTWRVTVKNMLGAYNLHEFDGCAVVVSGVSSTVYSGVTYQISLTGDYVDCDTCKTTDIDCCVSGVVDNVLVYYTDCCGNFVSGGSISDVVCFDPNYPFRGFVSWGTSCSVPCTTPTPTPTVTETQTPTVTPTPTSPCLDTNWMTWSGASGGTFSLIGGGQIDLTSSSTGTTQLQAVYQYSRLSCPDKNPSGNVQAIQNPGIYTYTFSQPVTNPLLAVYTLGRDVPFPAITASLSADTPFTVYCSATSNPSYAITYDLLNQSFSGTEGYGIVQFVGTVTQINLDYTPFEQYTQLIWGIPCIGIPSTPTPTPTITNTQTPTVTPSVTETPTNTPTETPTPTVTPSQTSTPLPCVCTQYELVNTSLTDTANFTYYDCYLYEQNDFIPPDSVYEICCCNGTLIVPSYVNVTLIGNCGEFEPSPTPSNTPTPTVTPSVTTTTTLECSEEYCLNTGVSEFSTYDGTYYSAGTYNSFLYYTGGTEPGYIFFDNISWCLSDTLGGDCLLTGPIPYTTNCPDFSDSLFYSGVCITTTTTTNPCSTFDFDAYFDCDYTTTTTTVIDCDDTGIDFEVSAYTTTTTTICTGTSVSATFTRYTTTTTTTPTTTTTTTLTVSFNGIVTYTVFDEPVVCPNLTFNFQDCDTGQNYYVIEQPEVGGIPINPGEVYQLYINTFLVCATYLGTSPQSSNAILGELMFINPDCDTCLSSL